LAQFLLILLYFFNYIPVHNFQWNLLWYIRQYFNDFNIISSQYFNDLSTRYRSLMNFLSLTSIDLIKFLMEVFFTKHIIKWFCENNDKRYCYEFFFIMFVIYKGNFHSNTTVTLWVWIQLRQGVLDTTLCDKVCQWLTTGRCFSPGTPVSSTYKTYRQILLKVALNTITFPQAWQYL